MIEPWHGTWDDRPEWDRPRLSTTIITAAVLWAVGIGQIRWLVRHLR